jgi:CRISPR system Cascade subunit CasD
MRDTGREPSKSGVIGLLCAALGRPRHEPVDDLAALRMGVRVDREGRLEKDFHTAGLRYDLIKNDEDTRKQGKKVEYHQVNGELGTDNPIISNRYYLADACFLVGLEGDFGLLGELYNALANPVWPLYLGRKAFVPGSPPWLPDGLCEGWELAPALTHYPWLGRGGEPSPERLRLVLEDPQGSVMVHDSPVSFVQRARRFRPRRVSVEYIPLPAAAEEG